MLVLSRKRKEVIVIGDGIAVEVLEITPTRVKLGIVAPDDVRVLRQELVPFDGPDRRTEPALA